MADPRHEQLARILVETCLDVQPGWQVLVWSGPAARPLVREVVRCLARNGAYALMRLSFRGGGGAYEYEWMREAPAELLSAPASIEVYAQEHADAAVIIPALENTREASVREFEDFVYGACLPNWTKERERISRYAERFDAGEEVRIVAAGTDLTLSIAGRSGLVDAGGANMPGGEFFYCPVEDSAAGTIAFEWPGVYQGREVNGIRLRFEHGRVVDAAADTNEAYLHELLDVDEGARRLGELGIGCNPGITRHMKNAAYDEKIDGTVHIALGTGLPFLGGTNVSRVHWDIVKDLRESGQLYLDGELVQDRGKWLI